MRKFSSILVVVVAAMMFSVALVSCGGQDPEKLKKVQDAFSDVQRLTNEVTSLVDRAASLDLLDQAAIDEYNYTVVDELNRLGEIDLASASNGELDEILRDLNQLKVDVAEAKGIFEGVLAAF